MTRYQATAAKRNYSHYSGRDGQLPDPDQDRDRDQSSKDDPLPPVTIPSTLRQLSFLPPLVLRHTLILFVIVFIVVRVRTRQQQIPIVQNPTHPHHPGGVCQTASSMQAFAISFFTHPFLSKTSRTEFAGSKIIQVVIIVIIGILVQRRSERWFLASKEPAAPSTSRSGSCFRDTSSTRGRST